MGVITNNDSSSLMIPLMILLVLQRKKYLENKTCNSTVKRWLDGWMDRFIPLTLCLTKHCDINNQTVNTLI